MKKIENNTTFFKSRYIDIPLPKPYKMIDGIIFKELGTVKTCQPVKMMEEYPLTSK